jgi:hypothetical protein
MEYAKSQPGRPAAMRVAASTAQMLVRISGLTAVVLGLLFWAGYTRNLLPMHMLAGALLVLSVWTLAFLAARAGVNRGFVVLAVLWGLIVPVFGLTQAQLLPGEAHWVIQVLHLLVGMVAMGLGQGQATSIKLIQTPTQQA